MESTKSFVAVKFKTLQGVTERGTECLRMPIQVGMVKYIDGKQVGDPYACYIKPPVPAPWYQFFSTVITWEDCEHAKTFPEVYPELLEFAEDLPLVAFYSTNDVNAMKEACAYYGLDNAFCKSRFIDPYTQCLIKYKYPAAREEFCPALYYWSQYFDLSCGCDGLLQSAVDVLLCAELYLHLQSTDLNALLEKRPPNPGQFQSKGVKKDKALFGDPVPEDEVVFPYTPLNRKYVCLTGFSYAIENTLNLKLKQLGAGRHDDPIKKTDIIIPSQSYLEKDYDLAPGGKVAKAIKDNKYIMTADELKEILISCGLYNGELE